MLEMVYVLPYQRDPSIALSNLLIILCVNKIDTPLKLKLKLKCKLSFYLPRMLE